MAAINNSTSSPDDDEVIAITLILRPTGPQGSLPKREFILNRHRPSIRIGRASKVYAKGFVAAINNAWFDSPVMSRQHAELIFDNDSTPKGVFIKDIGSLHGTFHTPNDGTGNESRLEQHKLVRLSHGDLLRFGTDIFRAAATFPPCSLEFQMARQQQPKTLFHPNLSQSTNRVFTIPDDIDDEDEDEDDSVIETAMPSTQKNGIQRGPSIDLTQDDTDDADDHTAHNHLTSDIIDLTSEPGGHSDHELNAVSNRDSSALSSTAISFIPSVAPPGSSSFRICGYVPDLPTATYDSPRPAAVDDIPDQFSDHTHRSFHCCHQDDEDMGSEDIRLTDSENDSVVTRDSLDDMDAVDEETDEDGDEGEDESGSSRSVSYDHESVSSGHDDSYDGRLDTWEDYESVSFSSDPADSESEASYPVLDSPEEILNKAATSTAAPPEPSDAKQPFVTPFQVFTAPTQQGAPVAHPREPSPSDAAMFKSHPRGLLENPPKSDSKTDRTSSDSRATVLGLASGKYKFFEARESNRATLMDQLTPAPVSAIRETLGGNTDHRADRVEADQASRSSIPPPVVGGHTKPAETDANMDCASKVSPQFHSNTANVLFDDVQMQEPQWPKPISCSGWPLSGDRFINNPRNEDLPGTRAGRPQSPELDMTSAYTFQLSKMATESCTSQQPRRVGINDLLVQEANRLEEMLRDKQPVPAPMPPMLASPPIVPGACQIQHEPNLKRSFEDAFDEEPVSSEVPGNSSQSIVQPSDGFSSELFSSEPEAPAASEDTPIEALAPQAIVPQSEMRVEPVAVNARPDYFQPSKRRRFAQAAACVALGGAAAFTFMVSTAPVL